MTGAKQTHKPEFIKLATILPVQRATHTETVIIMICNDWQELVNLCHDPRAYLKSQQFVFDELTDSFVEWELFSPATIAMKCGGRDPYLAKRTASLLPKDCEMGRKVAQLNDDDREDPAELANIMAGLFHIEFATYTTFVNVIYYPSGEPLDLEGTIAYKNAFSDAVLLSTGEGGTASFHVDIDQSMRARGQLAASIAQDPQWVRDQFSKLQTRTVVGTLGPPSKRLPDVAEPGEPCPLGDRLQLTPGNKFAKYMDLTLTGLSNPQGGTYNCLLIVCPANGADGFTMAAANTVVYNHAQFETEEVIRRTVSEMSHTPKDPGDGGAPPVPPAPVPPPAPGA